MTQTRASINQTRKATLAALDQQIADLGGVMAALQQARTALFIWASGDELDAAAQAAQEHTGRRSIKELAAKMAGNGQ